MTSQELLHISRNISVAEADGVLTLAGRRQQVKLPATTPGVRCAIDRLVSGATTEDEMLDAAVERDGFMAAPYVTHLLRRIESSGMLSRTVMDDDRPVATIVAIAPRATRIRQEVDPTATYSLCRYAFLHREEGSTWLESPHRDFRVEILDPAALAVAAAFLEPRRPCDLPAAASRGNFLRALAETSLLQRADVQDEALPWEFHDLLFHVRSRLGRHNRPYGGTYSRADKLPPAPAVKPPMAENAIVLTRPDVDSLARHDVPFTQVLEERRSLRKQGERPLTVTQLGDLLYRTARVRRVFEGKGGDLSDRPYPGGGAIYELELYPVVDRCEGLQSGLYHYCPLRHVLEPVAGRTPAVEQLLENAWMTLNHESRPQVLLVLTARFARLAAKYDSMAYALVLKDVGVLDQSLYLVATAMGLAPCALGGGDSELFAAASGIDAFAEGAVGEFVVGSRPESER